MNAEKTTEPTLVPFNLDRALAGDPVVRRDGAKIAQVLHFTKNGNLSHPVVAVTDLGVVSRCTPEGRFSADPFLDTSFDLFMVPKTQQVYFNVYADSRSGSPYAVGSFLTEEAARSAFAVDSPYYIKTISVEVPA